MALSYPNAVELAEFLYDSGVIKSYPVDYTLYETAVSAAVAAFLRETKWDLFIAEQSDSVTDYRDWEDDYLDFEDGYVSITSVEIDGVAATEFTDYRAFPAKGSPKRSLSLFRIPNEKVTVTGRRGYCDSLPDDAYRAILSYGASLAWSQLNTLGVISSVKQGDVQYTYAQSTSAQPTNQYAQWQTYFNETVTRYKRGLV